MLEEQRYMTRSQFSRDSDTVLLERQASMTICAEEWQHSQDHNLDPGVLYFIWYLAYNKLYIAKINSLINFDFQETITIVKITNISIITQSTSFPYLIPCFHLSLSPGHCQGVFCHYRLLCIF
jgi:hypothetical protein